MGQWVSVPQYGPCWRPYGVQPGWQPYTVGHWVYTQYGWTWASDEPWGNVTCHYGAWVLDPAYGWVWVPGRVWAPAWVAWREGDGYVGWAPLPPEACGYSIATSNNYYIERIPPSHFCFIEERHFTRDHVWHDFVPHDRNPDIIRRTHDSTRIDVNRRIAVNRSLDPSHVEHVTGTRVQRHDVSEVIRRPEPPRPDRPQNHPAPVGPSHPRTPVVSQPPRPAEPPHRTAPAPTPAPRIQGQEPTRVQAPVASPARVNPPTATRKPAEPTPKQPAVAATPKPTHKDTPETHRPAAPKPADTDRDPQRPAAPAPTRRPPETPHREPAPAADPKPTRSPETGHEAPQPRRPSEPPHREPAPAPAPKPEKPEHSAPPKQEKRPAAPAEQPSARPANPPHQEPSRPRQSEKQAKADRSKATDPDKSQK
jgi:hypothetical protein